MVIGADGYLNYRAKVGVLTESEKCERVRDVRVRRFRLNYLVINAKG